MGSRDKLYSFFNIALDGIGAQRHDPTALPVGKARYPLYKRLGGPKAGVDGCGNLAPTVASTTAANVVLFVIGFGC
jgi:hypothetical protein